jgi:hypothetical protein
MTSKTRIQAYAKAVGAGVPGIGISISISQQRISFSPTAPDRRICTCLTAWAA